MRPPTVFFYCRDDDGNLQEDVIALAEGFRELGVPFFGSCNYWRQSCQPDDYLIRLDPSVWADDCDIVVVSYTWPFWIRTGTFDLVRRPLPEGLFRPGRRYRTVYMDNHDGHRTVSWEPRFRDFDLILRSKLNARAWYPENMRPWVLGLTDRLVQATDNAIPFTQRRRAMLWNFGASHPYPHGARELARRRFLPAATQLMPIDRTMDDLSLVPEDPYEALMWRQTGGRYSTSYYERLKATQSVACFCGDLIPPMPYRNPECHLSGGNRAKLKHLIFTALGKLDPRPPRSVQWDSFRFWEALAAGCVAFNLNLAQYGAILPVMPQNWTHYIGVDLEHMGPTLDRLKDEPECLNRIAAAGRIWALENYSPATAAKRFLAAMVGK